MKGIMRRVLDAFFFTLTRDMDGDLLVLIYHGRFISEY